ncbi:MAG: hypothetical protein V4606_02060 [Patescibacteria group bacterium]
MEAGDIVFGTNNHLGSHPIVFLSDIDEYSFHGVMLTHSSKRGNVLPLPEHFIQLSKNYDISTTPFVTRSLIEKKE